VGLTLLAGCSTAGNRLTFFPQGHQLIDSARMIRSAYPQPLPLPRELDKRVSGPYTVEPGDVLLVQPADLDSPVRLPGDQPVLPDGTISLGRYGKLLVAGKTVEEIETAARAQIEAYLKANPDALAKGPPDTPVRSPGPIVARPINRVSKVYYVLGEVNAPGSFVLQGRETVLDAILAAGGLTDRASRKNIILSRPTAPAGCRVVLPICYNEIVQLGDTATNYQVAAGDRIYVPTREPHENGGLFHKPQPDCPPCGGPQSPCPVPGGEHSHPHPEALAPTPALPPALPDGPPVPPAVALPASRP
jgi:protein involved in polysaccharide export with SLBB domain